ncbi:MAG TPA: hypothetical protein VJN92_23675 [Candidatus Acidoferrum sp.]|nr:hypothetical protein [Candidatus Acidoferrum sp.]
MNLRCDGCGQEGSPEHIARRLRRLEWATRFRPVHIQTLLLGGVAPREDAEFLYAPGGEFRGEAEILLRGAGIPFAEKSADTVHEEFQAAGLFLTHVLECPLQNGPNVAPNASKLLCEHLPAAASRIRRSLKPKRVMLVTEIPEEVVQDVLALDLGCEVILNEGKPFALTPPGKEEEIARFRAVLDSRAIR